ncbi:hypothetical protein ATK78_1344 [Pedobacter metabolipauper]|uniref:Uncharacterized protein n=1 Tax=Pedobacter metabolipauper TaxID=425513 RepID=A0A4R6T3T9_9SPHI|nr:hypothetical protein ATK78_1344 [Pedobacter metabolipauper]
MGEKKIWPSGAILTVHDTETDLTSKEKLNLKRDVQYWKESSKRKDKDIIHLNNKVRGLKSHITRLQAALHKKGVYKI